MLRRGESDVAGTRLNSKVGLLVLALVVGAAVPALGAVYVASQDPAQPGCHTGIPTASRSSGSLLVARGSALYFAANGNEDPRKLFDFNPPPARPSPSPSASGAAQSPSPSPSGPRSPSPSTAPSPSASPSPAPPPTQLLAAAVSDSRQLVAVMVANPPGELQQVSVRFLSPFDPPGTAPQEVWSGTMPSNWAGRAEITMLSNDTVLFRAPAGAVADGSKRLVGVATTNPKPKLSQAASENDYINNQQASWPETRNLKALALEPSLDQRIVAPNGTTVGLRDGSVRTPLLNRRLHELRSGSVGYVATTLLCAGTDELTPVAISPDNHAAAVVSGDTTYVIELSGGHSLTRMLDGRLLDWRA